VSNTGLKIREAAIDLSGDREAIGAECDRLARLVFDAVPPVTEAAHGDGEAA
jgi:hypothetical protein